MNNILGHFKKIASIPHCSFDAKLLKDEIISFAKSCAYEVSVDESENILCKKGKPKLCLQSHYDMVCIGDAPKIELLQEGNILKAKNSTLGADNGMGMAIMFACMQKYDNLECLFTSNEEVGLIGANNLQLQLSADKLLNLDGEQEDEIYIGCAGGVDIISTCKIERIKNTAYKYAYKASLTGLDGGHSGVDIDKGIDSAIKILFNKLATLDIKLVELYGGEMRNSIAKSAHAILLSNEPLELKGIALEQIEATKLSYIKNSDKILKVIHAFAQGVRSYSKDFMIPLTSINMGKIRLENEVLQIDCAARAMDDESLEILANETISLFELAGFTSLKKDFHSAWKPEVNDFALLVQEVMNKTYEGIELKAIHAGLECGMLIEKQKQKTQAVSIGPTIRFPHSLKEECDLDSVLRIFNVVDDIIKKLK